MLPTSKVWLIERTVLLSRILQLTNQTQLRPVCQLLMWNFKKLICPAYITGDEDGVFNFMR